MSGAGKDRGAVATSVHPADPDPGQVTGFLLAATRLADTPLVAQTQTIRADLAPGLAALLPSVGVPAPLGALPCGAAPFCHET